MQRQNIVIIESPSKANTIMNFLGPKFKVVASKGHVRDLPKSTLGVDIDNNFEAHYINIRGKGELITSLKKEVKNADKVYLATDPDREGEAISWHLIQALGLDSSNTHRVTFNELTKNAVINAINNPREIDMNLVDSQQARRILDRIVGYQISPFLWSKIKSGLSAGRVQSVATRIIVEREEQIRAFVPEEYWVITADLVNSDNVSFKAKFHGNASGKIEIRTEEDAQKIVSKLSGNNFCVKNVHKTSKKRNPLPPFTTSTLQQDASKKYGYQADRIMRIAQELYEGINVGAENGGTHGLITYMRTDSLRISDEARFSARSFIVDEYGERYYPEQPRVYKSKNGAQDAHEAIRPTNVYLLPKNVKKYLSAEQYKIYKLIWERFVASQMASAVLDTVSIDLSCGDYVFKSSGSSIRFGGYLSVYDNVRDNEDEEDNITKLPSLSEGESLSCNKVIPEQHFTEGPAHFNDATLIKFLEEKGIGRPSTFATTISTIISREYVIRDGRSLKPTKLGEIITKLLLENFEEVVDYQFTAQMEEELDDIADGTTTANSVLSKFYERFKKSLDIAQSNVSKESIEIEPETTNIPCPTCGKLMVIKKSRYGRFAACPAYPKCKTTMHIDKDNNPVMPKEDDSQPTDLTCEKCGAPMLLRSGRYGKFYACSKYPTCKNTIRIREQLDIKCPECNGEIVTNHVKGRVFYGCSNYPNCNFSIWDLPVKDKCPICNSLLIYKKSKKMIQCYNKDCNYTKIKEDH